MKNKVTRVSLSLLIDTPFWRLKKNPADIRRIYLLAKHLNSCGYIDANIISKKSVLRHRSDIHITQSRDYNFWIVNEKVIRAHHKKIVFTCSDALASHNILSQAHKGDEPAAAQTITKEEYYKTQEYRFLNDICDMIIVGSESQKRILIDYGVNTPIRVIEDFIDTIAYNFRAASILRNIRSIFYAKRNEVNIFWEGYIDNVPYLKVCSDAIAYAEKALGIKITVYIMTSRFRRNKFLGTTDNREIVYKIFGPSAKFVRWSRFLTTYYMSKSCIGLAPVFSNDCFANSKPPNKPIIYGYMGIVPLMSDIMSYQYFLKKTGVGVVVESDDEWGSGLVRAITLAQQRSASETHDRTIRHFGQSVIICKYLEYLRIESV